ncbi:hypothetical protein ABN584_25320 [Gloeocapsa sp. BRSZ]
MKPLHSFISTVLDNQDLYLFKEVEKICGSQLELLSQYEKLALVHIFYCYLHVSLDIEDYTLTDALFDALQSAAASKENQKVCQILFLLEKVPRRNILIFAQFVAGNIA